MKNLSEQDYFYIVDTMSDLIYNRSVYLKHVYPSFILYLNANSIKLAHQYEQRTYIRSKERSDFISKKDWEVLIDITDDCINLTFFNYLNPNNNFYLVSLFINDLDLLSGSLKQKIQNHILLR